MGRRLAHCRGSLRPDELGANVVRIHLQLGKFMDAPEKANEKALARLGKLLALAEKESLYLDLTGLGCYHKKDVPAWYDKLSEKERWDVQARFWQAVEGRCRDCPAVFCFDLMNETIFQLKSVFAVPLQTRASNFQVAVTTSIPG